MHILMNKLFLKGILCTFAHIKEITMDWTNEQKQAIYEKGNNILVAAAARQW